MPNLSNNPFNGELQNVLLYILLKGIEQKTILYTPERAGRTLNIDGYAPEVVFLHYSVLHDDGFFQGFADLNSGGRVVAFRLTSKGYQKLHELEVRRRRDGFL